MWLVLNACKFTNDVFLTSSPGSVSHTVGLLRGERIIPEINELPFISLGRPHHRSSHSCLHTRHESWWTLVEKAVKLGNTGTRHKAAPRWVVRLDTSSCIPKGPCSSGNVEQEKCLSHKAGKMTCLNLGTESRKEYLP